MKARLVLILLTVAAPLACGCKSLLGKTDSDAPKQPTGEIPPRSAADLVSYLNRQASLIQSISYSDVSVQATENGKDLPRLGNSTLAAAKPRNFRLNAATHVTSNEVDLGSNDREFWMYVKRLEGPHNFFYCSHEEFARGAGKRFPIPFDTDWVMQALGMASFPDDAQYTADVNKQYRKYVLAQTTVTPNGQHVKKLIAFNVDHDSGKKPIVWKHLIVDERDQTLASAEILRAKAVKVGNDFVQVPTEVVLDWPAQKFRMRLTLDGEKVNEDLRERGQVLFTRPQIRGANPIDLATYSFEPTVRSQNPERRR